MFRNQSGNVVALPTWATQRDSIRASTEGLCQARVILSLVPQLRSHPAREVMGEERGRHAWRRGEERRGKRKKRKRTEEKRRGGGREGRKEEREDDPN